VPNQQQGTLVVFQRSIEHRLRELAFLNSGVRIELADHRGVEAKDVELYYEGGTRAFVPMLKGQGSGHLVNIASLAGLVHPAGMASYNAVKAAVVALTETTGHELAAYGVRAHAVCPSYFRTNLMDSVRGPDPALVPNHATGNAK